MRIPFAGLLCVTAVVASSVRVERTPIESVASEDHGAVGRCQPSGASAVVARSVPHGIAPSDRRRSRTVAEEASADDSIARIAFPLDCPECVDHADFHDVRAGEGGVVEPFFFFDLRVFSAEQLCSVPNITLNGHSLATSPPSPPPFKGRPDPRVALSGYGAATVPISLYPKLSPVDVGFSWTVHCLSLEEDIVEPQSRSSAVLLSVSIDHVNQSDTQSSLGFLLSFNQTGSPQPLRLEPIFISDPTVNRLSGLRDWISPPARLRAAPDSNGVVDPDFLRLQHLEREAAELQRQIDEKRQKIELHRAADPVTAASSPENCQNFRCVVRYFLHKAHGAAQILYTKLPSFHLSKDPSEQVAAMHDPTGPDVEAQADCIQPPEPCHCPPGKTNVADETPCECPSTSQTQDGYHVLDSSPPARRNPFLTLLHVLLSIVTLAFVFRIVRSCCCSPRKRAERSARREERAAERQRRSAASSHRRPAWRPWQYNRSASANLLDCDEKAQLVHQQEAVLEREMQGEIRSLQIAHDIVSSMVRPEVCQACGLNPGVPGPTITHHIHPAAYQISPYLAFMAPATHHGSSSNPFRSSARRPRPITIPSPGLSTTSSSPVRSRSSSDGSSSGRSISGWSGLSGVSRTTTLPAYRTDASDDGSDDGPPPYGDDDAGEHSAVVDGFGQAEPEGGDLGRHPRRYVPSLDERARGRRRERDLRASAAGRMWSPQSTAADADVEFSPRASIDTLDSRGPGIVGFAYV